jgi:hypothetical protein
MTLMLATNQEVKKRGFERILFVNKDTIVIYYIVIENININSRKFTKTLKVCTLICLKLYNFFLVKMITIEHLRLLHILVNHFTMQRR